MAGWRVSAFPTPVLSFAISSNPIVPMVVTMLERADQPGVAGMTEVQWRLLMERRGAHSYLRARRCRRVLLR